MRNQLGLLPLRTGRAVSIIQSTDIFNSMSFTLLETGELDISNLMKWDSVYSLKKNSSVVWERRNSVERQKEQQGGVDKEDNDDPNFN